MTVHGWKLLSSHVMTFQLNGPKQCSFFAAKRGYTPSQFGKQLIFRALYYFSDAFFVLGSNKNSQYLDGHLFIDPFLYPTKKVG